MAATVLELLLQTVPVEGAWKMLETKEKPEQEPLHLTMLMARTTAQLNVA